MRLVIIAGFKIECQFHRHALLSQIMLLKTFSDAKKNVQPSTGPKFEGRGALLYPALPKSAPVYHLTMFNLDEFNPE